MLRNGPMSIDDCARWLSRVTLAVAIIMIGWGLSGVLRQPVTTWFTASATIWMALLLLSAFWQLRGSFTAIAASALATDRGCAPVQYSAFEPAGQHRGLERSGSRPAGRDGPGRAGLRASGLVPGRSRVRPF